MWLRYVGFFSSKWLLVVLRLAAQICRLSHSNHITFIMSWHEKHKEMIFSKSDWSHTPMVLCNPIQIKFQQSVWLLKLNFNLSTPAKWHIMFFTSRARLTNHDCSMKHGCYINPCLGWVTGNVLEESSAACWLIQSYTFAMFWLSRYSSGTDAQHCAVALANRS